MDKYIYICIYIYPSIDTPPYVPYQGTSIINRYSWIINERHLRMDFTPINNIHQQSRIKKGILFIL